MIIGFHLCWTTYGHWFPNDPRGSWSETVWKPELERVRPLDDDRRVTSPRPVSRATLQPFLDRARRCLRTSSVQFSPAEIRLIAASFAEMVAAADVTVHACAIMSNHVHVVVGRGKTSYERTINRLKGRSAQRIREARGWSHAAHRRERIAVWTKGYWSRYIDHPAQMERAIAYVRANPVRSGLPLQRWDFLNRDVSHRSSVGGVADCV